MALRSRRLPDPSFKSLVDSSASQRALEILEPFADG